MKIAIVGGGYTGLSAALKLSSTGHEVTIFEKEKYLGGLAASFKLPDWQWSIEQHYHHWFTNDIAVISLLKNLGISDKLIFPKSLTAIYYNNQIYPFNTPGQLLNFTPLPIAERLRTGIVSLYLKLLPKSQAIHLEKYQASSWIEKYYGKKASGIIWQPLLSGKFGKYKDFINMAWFWSRIKKRTLTLGYLEGGFETLVNKLEEELKENGVVIKTRMSFDPKTTSHYDKVIVTTPSVVFLKMYPDLPENYRLRLQQIPHLHALNLLLITDKKILDKVYWLNINDKGFPFIGVIQQTNMIDAKYYGGKHLAWIANYLPPGHPYLKKTPEELFNTYLPYLQKINPAFNFQLSIFNFQLFSGPFAQPVFPVNYSKIIPQFTTPIPNVFLANMDMVYPWDRGTNYAIELGEKVAEYTIRK